MADLSQLSQADMQAIASRNFDALSEEGRRIAFSNIPMAQPEPEDEVSAIRRFQYGFEKTKSDVGLLYRSMQVNNGFGQLKLTGTGLDYIPAEEAFGENFANAPKEVKAAVLEKIEQRRLEREYPELADQEGIGGFAGFAGTLAGALFSPTTLIPIGAAGKVGYKTLATAGGLFGLEYNVLDQLASTAQVDVKEAALATGVGAIATPVTAKAFSALGSGVQKALAKRSSPAKKMEADEVMYEAQAAIHEYALSPEGANATADDFIKIVQSRLGLDKDTLAEYQAISDVKIKIPGARSRAQKLLADEQSARTAYTETGAVRQGFRDYTGIVSTEVNNISSNVGAALKRHDGLVHTTQGKYLKQAEPFLKFVRQLPAKTATQLTRHLINGEADAARSLATRISADGSKIIDDTYDLLNEMFKYQTDVGVILGKIDNFFPRKTKDYKQFLQQIGKQFRDPIELELGKRAKKAGLNSIYELPLLEFEDVVTNIMRVRQKGAFSVKSSSRAGRKLAEVDESLIGQYKSADNALIDYIFDTVAFVEKRKFLGDLAVTKGVRKIDLKDSVDKLIARELATKSISEKDVPKLTELLTARFGMGERSSSAGTNIAKNLIYQATLANPMSALTQIADVGMSVFANGLIPTVRALLGKRDIKAKDLNLTSMISSEMGTVGKMAKFLDFTFTWSGFKLIDRIGKETLANAAYLNARKMAKSTTGVNKLRKKYGKIFGNEFDSLVTDLKAGNLTDNVYLMASTEVSNYQPTSLSEMPLRYLQADKGRVFYALKSFTLKQFDVMRREIVDEFAKGNTDLATKKLLGYMLIMPLAGATVQETKDFISRGDEIAIDDIPDQYIKNVFKIMGTSQWMIENKLAQGKITAAVGEVVLPPVSLFDGLADDVMKLAKGELRGKDSEILSRIPVLGALFQSFMLGAREDRRREDIMRGD
jgi:hypothetical protein